MTPDSQRPEQQPQVRLEHAGAMCIAGLRSRFTHTSLDDIPTLWGRLAARAPVPGRAGPVDHAVVLPGPDGIDYLAGCEVRADAVLPPDFSRIDIPAHDYAVFPHEGHVSLLRYTVQRAVDLWLPSSAFDIARLAGAEPYLLERYGERFDPQAGIGDIEVWIPVVGRYGQQYA